MSNIIVDVEADGPCPGLYSMVCFGAVCLETGDTFYAQCRPDLEADCDLNALSVSGFTREEVLAFPHAKYAMADFEIWLGTQPGRPMFWSDNNGFDWQFINYYFWRALGRNPFGHSSSNIGSLYKGIVRDVFKNFKHLRKTKHDHHPVNDARGNAEALLHMKNEMRLKI